MTKVNYADAMMQVFPDRSFVANGTDYDGLVMMDGLPAPTKKTLDDAWPQVQYDRDYKQVEEARRQRYMSETDGMFFAAQREGGDLGAWEAAVAAIKAELPYPTAP